MDRWPSFSRFGSSKLPRDHAHVAVFTFILRVTYMRPSELLELRKKDLVPSLVPLLPCWSVVIAAYETGVFTKTGVLDGSIVMDQRWFQRTNQVLPALKAGNPEEKIWNFDYPAAATLFKTATDALRFSGLTMYQTQSQHRSGAGFQHSARSPKTNSLSPLSPSPAQKQIGHTRATCVVDKATAGPAARKSMTGKYLLDMFGGAGFLSKATNDLGLRGYVLDTTFGTKYEVTKPLVLTWFRQDVPAGKCVAAVVSPPRPHTSCSSQKNEKRKSLNFLVFSNFLNFVSSLPLPSSPCWLGGLQKKEEKKEDKNREKHCFFSFCLFLCFSLFVFCFFFLFLFSLLCLLLKKFSVALSSRPGSLRRKQWVMSRVLTPSRKTDGSSL